MLLNNRNLVYFDISWNPVCNEDNEKVFLAKLTKTNTKMQIQYTTQSP